MSTRREFLRSALGSGLALAALPRLAFASIPGERRLIVVLLRGALDGLAAVPPYADPYYARARGALALASPGEAQGALDLDGTFGLHPALTALHERYRAGELLVAHAVGTPYRERSHFDGQNVLENGGERPAGAASGWLNRALAALPAGSVRGLAIGQNVPLILRGAVPVASWAPSAMPEVEADLIARLRDLYSGDALLAARLEEAIRIARLADEEGGMGGRAALRTGPGQLKLIVQGAARLLAEPEGPRIAVIETGGWDTHANQGAAQGPLAVRLRALDEALDLLRSSLGAVWRQTVVLLCTEFGRTVAVNGTRGTDHGTGTATFLVGGAVRGGRVLGDWPGLSERARHEGRDLAVTLDLRALAKGVLHEHLALPERALVEVFPASGPIAPLRDLVRG